MPQQQPQERVPVLVRNGTFTTTTASAKLLARIGGGRAILAITDAFYAKAFKDSIVCPFVEDKSEPHGERLALWIVEKMGGEGTPWTDSRPPDSRSRSHAKAWHSHKREPEVKGRRFKLHETRAWMRLMFWSAREQGLGPDSDAAFWNWYVGFIGHFIAVFERSAPPFAKADAEWSADPANIARYQQDGSRFRDLVDRG